MTNTACEPEHLM